MESPDKTPNKRTADSRTADSQTARKRSSKQLFVGFLVVVAIVSAGYRLIYTADLHRTAALFVGLPLLAAIALTRLPRATSATSMLLRGSTMLVLIAGIVTPEGLLCLLFALPLVLAVACVIGVPIDWIREGRNRKRNQDRAMVIAALPLFILSLEGVVGGSSATGEHASASRVVRATPAEVRASLEDRVAFNSPLPVFLRLGFNRPSGSTGGGIAVGDRRTILFRGGSHDEHPARLLAMALASMGRDSADDHKHTDESSDVSTMELTVLESDASHVVFGVDADGTMTSRWATLRTAEVTWRSVAPDSSGSPRTSVRWAFTYDRLVFPSFYFGPLQRYGFAQSAEFLLNSTVGSLERTTSGS